MLEALALAFAASPSASHREQRPVAAQCVSTGSRVIARKRDLPLGAAAALGMPMAEAGGAFKVTDAGPISDLPDRRFVSARQTGCTIALRYEKGGYAHTFETMSLSYQNGRWSRTP
ncbi:MAG: hypothetical protein JWQ16_940 [Novosphingobium sp.]|nr:hypothetical protein [Novosphingobium sp.]